MKEDSDLLNKYKKISNSLVLLHPQAKGIIQFIGSFIFGSFPACSYKYLHKFLFDHGYSLILYRFPLNPLQFNHWEVSLDLLKEQYLLKIEIVKILKAANISGDLINLYLQPENYLWLGHSLGCKYISLLEVLSQDSSKRNPILQHCLDQNDVKQIADRLKTAESLPLITDEAIGKMLPEIKTRTQAFIRNQPSVFIAPEISNTVRLRSNLRISNPYNNPNQAQTECLIASSKDIFNLAGIISFSSDDIAEDDVEFLLEQIKTRQFQPYLYEELAGSHFTPLQVQNQDLENLADRIDRFFDSLRFRAG